MLVVVIVWLDGVVMFGAIESINVCVTKIQKLASPLFPSASYAGQVTSVFPTTNGVPAACVHVGPLVTALSSDAETEP